MKLIHTVLPVLLSFGAFGQNAPAPVQFEVASIRPSGPPGADRVNVGLHIDGARISCTYLSLKDYIGMAYDMKEYQISGPDWLARDKFDITATLPAGAKADQLRDMMKSLLADRFAMTAHRDKKDFPVYGLVVGKNGPKLKESPPDPDSEAGESGKGGGGAVNVNITGGRGGVNINFGRGSFFRFADNKLVARKLSMVSLAEMLARFSDRPVVDMTGLKGIYDIDLEFTTEDYNAMLIRAAIAAGVTLPPEALRALEGSSGDSLSAALEKLGLKMETRKAPLDVLVVDHATKTPTEN